MTKLNLGDKVYRFINGNYDGYVYHIVDVGKDYYGIIPTDCTINGQVPTIENTTVEKYPLSQKTFVDGVGTISIHKATPELKDKVDKYRTRMIVIDKICEELKINRDFQLVKESLLKKTTKQLFAILFILIREADGKQGVCNINDKGYLENDFFIKEEIVNRVKEPEE